MMDQLKLFCPEVMTVEERSAARLFLTEQIKLLKENLESLKEKDEVMEIENYLHAQELKNEKM